MSTNLKKPTNAILKIKGFTDRKIIEYNYNFTQSIDKENQPAGIPRGGKLTVKVDACTQKGVIELLKWGVSTEKKEEVIIEVYKPYDPTVPLKTLIFKDAFCVDYKEFWKDLRESKGDNANTEEIQITWREFLVDKTSIYDNAWE
jgi:hypothetical protein